MELRGKPGGRIRVIINQIVEAEAADVIGSEGGVVEVTNSNSSIYKTKVIVPEESTSHNFFLSISLGRCHIVRLLQLIYLRYSLKDTCEHTIDIFLYIKVF